MLRLFKIFAHTNSLSFESFFCTTRSYKTSPPKATVRVQLKCMPRPPSPLWAHFIKVMPNKRATCKYCGLNMCGLVIRMRMHLARRCTSCPEHVKIEMSTEISHKHAASSDQPVKKMRIKKDERQEPAPPPDLEQPPAAVPALPHSVERDDATPSTDVTVLDDKSDLDGYVARAIFGAGIPVATVEHSAFIKMLKRMNPAYEPPSALVLGTSVLDLEYSEVQLKLRAEVLDATTVGLGVESWMTPHNRLLVSCVINQPSPAVFGFESTGKMPHTVEVLVDRIENIMTQIGTGKVSVIVTDTSDDMKQASLSLQHKYPAITFLPSCAHIMNSMVKEMLEMSTIATMIDTCKKLVSFFVQDPAARCAIARVSGHQETTAPLGDPSDASPIGLLQCLFTIERNRNSLDTLLAENGVLNNLNSKVKDEINSLVFWDEISMFTSLFEPFFEIMKMFESDSPLLSTFYHRFTLLWTHLDKYGSHTAKFQHIISKHWQSIQHPAIYTAYLLDPRFPPSGLSGEATSEALAYIKRTTSAEVYGSIVDELTRFTARSGLFADDAIWESAQKCSPINWWKGFIGSSCPNLQPMALRTLGFPASSGLSRSKRKMFEKIQVMNSKYMNEDQAGKAAIVYLNSGLVSNVEGGVVNTETLV